MKRYDFVGEVDGGLMSVNGESICPSPDLPSPPITCRPAAFTPIVVPVKPLNLFQHVFAAIRSFFSGIIGDWGIEDLHLFDGTDYRQIPTSQPMPATVFRPQSHPRNTQLQLSSRNLNPPIISLADRLHDLANTFAEMSTEELIDLMHLHQYAGDEQEFLERCVSQAIELDIGREATHDGTVCPPPIISPASQSQVFRFPSPFRVSGFQITTISSGTLYLYLV
jgi:hypothetical protein